MKWLQIKNKADNPEIFIYGDIGEWDDVSSTGFVSQLEELKGKDITLRINSNGGSVFTAQAIFSAIRRHDGESTAIIDGICASAATFIATACSKIKMPRNATWMVHKPLTAKMGNATDFRRAADVLDVIEETMIPAYMEKTGKSKEEIANILESELYMTAQDAFDFGFIDEIEDSIKIAASLDGDFLNYGGVSVESKNIPQSLLNAVKSVKDKPNEGEKPMDLTQIKAQFPDAVKAHAEEIKASIKTDIDNAVKAERQRVLDIQDAAFEGQSALVAKAIDDGLTAGEFAIQANKAWRDAEQSRKDNFLAQSEKDREALNSVQTPVPVKDDEDKQNKEVNSFIDEEFTNLVNKGV